MKYCPECGSAIEYLRPAGDHRSRAHCRRCRKIHYENPRPLVAVILYHEKSALWIKRANDPHKGKWAIPTGFVELDESLQEAAARELFEETTIAIPPRNMVPLTMLSLVDLGQLYIAFRSNCETTMPAAITSEVEDWGWLKRDEVPWKELAHQQIYHQMQLIYDCLDAGRFVMTVGKLDHATHHYDAYRPEA